MPDHQPHQLDQIPANMPNMISHKKPIPKATIPHTRPAKAIPSPLRVPALAAIALRALTPNTIPKMARAKPTIGMKNARIPHTVEATANPIVWGCPSLRDSCTFSFDTFPPWLIFFFATPCEISS